MYHNIFVVEQKEVEGEDGGSENLGVPRSTCSVIERSCLSNRKINFLIIPEGVRSENVTKFRNLSKISRLLIPGVGVESTSKGEIDSL